MGKTTPPTATRGARGRGTEALAAPAHSYSGALWIGQCGKPLGYAGTKARIVEATRATIGVPISPHDFRRNGATTAAFRAGSDPHLGSGLLQHSDPRTREEHYNRASNLTAAVEFAELVSELRSH